VCPRQGHKVFTLQTIPSWEDGDYGTNQVGKMAGFSLHAGVATKRVNVRSWNDCVAISLLLIRKIPGADFSGNGDVRVEDTVPGWDNACHIRAAGLHREVSRAGG
jgi:hypothetical protein